MSLMTTGWKCLGYSESKSLINISFENFSEFGTGRGSCSYAKTIRNLWFTSKGIIQVMEFKE